MTINTIEIHPSNTFNLNIKSTEHFVNIWINAVKLMPHIHYETCLSASWWRPGLSPWQGSWTGRRSWLRQPPGRRRICCPHRGQLRGTEGSSGESPAEPPLGDTREVDGCPLIVRLSKIPLHRQSAHYSQCSFLMSTSSRQSTYSCVALCAT